MTDNFLSQTFEQLLIVKIMTHKDKGNLDWEILDYEQAEKKDYFSGLRIGKVKIYLISPTTPTKYVIERNGGVVREMKEEEFNMMLEVFFEDNEKEYINKCLWRKSS